MRGRPRKYGKKDKLIRVSLPVVVMKWLTSEAGAIRRSVPEAVRFIIVGKFEADQKARNGK